MTAEARAALHSLGFLRFTCTVVLKPVSHFDTSLSSQAVWDSWKLDLSSVLCSTQCNLSCSLWKQKETLFKDESLFFYTIYSSNSFAGWGIFKWRFKKQQLCDSADVWMSWGGGWGVEEGGEVSLTRGETEYRSRDSAFRWARRHEPSVRLWAQQEMSRRSTLSQPNPLKWLL